MTDITNLNKHMGHSDKNKEAGTMPKRVAAFECRKETLKLCAIGFLCGAAGMYSYFKAPFPATGICIISGWIGFGVGLSKYKYLTKKYSLGFLKNG